MTKTLNNQNKNVFNLENSNFGIVSDFPPKADQPRADDIRISNLKGVLKIFLLLVCWMSTTTVALASSCAEPPPVEESYAISSSVFVGKVMMVRERTRNVKVSFKVYKVFKGTLDDVSVVLTSLPNDIGQGYPFHPEEQYLVFTYLQEGRDHTNLCTRTKPLSEASTDIKILDRILRQEPPPAAAATPSL
ncbi:MAG: hypothetical protein HZC18_06080 [Candidatus Omnitrophica bacterium]|nr:hypothetical protein [Candidatus Omnitrophota bacterium]